MASAASDVDLCLPVTTSGCSMTGSCASRSSPGDGHVLEDELIARRRGSPVVRRGLRARLATGDSACRVPAELTPRVPTGLPLWQFHRHPASSVPASS